MRRPGMYRPRMNRLGVSFRLYGYCYRAIAVWAGEPRKQRIEPCFRRPVFYCLRYRTTIGWFTRCARLRCRLTVGSFTAHSVRLFGQRLVELYDWIERDVWIDSGASAQTRCIKYLTKHRLLTVQTEVVQYDQFRQSLYTVCERAR